MTKINAKLKNIGQDKFDIIDLQVSDLNSLLTLTGNYSNRLVWVNSEKNFYSLKSGEIGNNINHWEKYTSNFKVDNWDSGKTYTAGEFCFYNGKLWYSNNVANINEPPTNWTLIKELPKFNPIANDNEVMLNTVGNIEAGTTVSDLRNRDLTSIVYDMLFPIKSAYINIPADNLSRLRINNNRNINESGLEQLGNELNIEVLTNPTYGQIKNGDETIAGPIMGNLDSIIVRDDMNAVIPFTSGNSFLNFVINNSNLFRIESNFLGTNTEYHNSRGEIENHINIGPKRFYKDINITGTYFSYLHLFTDKLNGIDNIDTDNKIKSVFNDYAIRFLPNEINKITIPAGTKTIIGYLANPNNYVGIGSLELTDGTIIYNINNLDDDTDQDFGLNGYVINYPIVMWYVNNGNGYNYDLELTFKLLVNNNPVS